MTRDGGVDASVTPGAREAATVLLVRDAPALEVFMLRRNLQSAWNGGVHLFPGGALEPGDRDDAVRVRCPDRSDADASARLGHRSGGLGYWVAAIREAFEEAGVLLARHGDGRALDPQDAAWARLTEARDALNAGDLDLRAVLEDEELILEVDALEVFAHWVTPPGQIRRYDTWFFVAAAPAGHTYEHDAIETVASVWMRPEDAVTANDRGEIDLILPTRRSLEVLCAFPDAASVLAHARRVGGDGTHRVRMVDDVGGGECIPVPGDAGVGAAS
ncbi:MAG: NUDIX hydrolase [Actinomycetes bacterium]